MGTRADFYIGRGDSAEWLGSIAWDGYDVPEHILRMDKPENFRAGVEQFLESRDDATFPKDGWPWPWEDSTLTDEVWAFDGGRVWNARGYPTARWYAVDRECHVEQFAGDEDQSPDDLKKWEETHDVAVFPNMKDKARVTLGKRSGLIVIGG
jgi:hypothetical protein